MKQNNTIVSIPNPHKELRLVQLKDLKHFDGNPRHNNQSAKMVAKSIQEFGFINPIVVDEENVILAGNTRYKALGLLGVTEAEVLVVTGLTNEQKRGFVIADNRAGEYSKWNMAALDRMLEAGEIDASMLEDFGILSVRNTKKKLEKMIYEQDIAGSGDSNDQ